MKDGFKYPITKKHAFRVFFFILALLGVRYSSWTDSVSLIEESQASDLSDAVAISNRLYRSLTGGIPLISSNPLYSPIVSKVMVKDYLGAAALITDPTSGSDEFYNNTVADLAQTMNQLGTAVGFRNDLCAMFLGAVRDGMGADELLTKDFTYYDPTGTPTGVLYAIDDSGTGCQGSASPGTSCNSNHYMQVWSTTNPKLSLRKFPHPGFPGVGIFTSWTWAQNYDLAGTGRRNIKGIMENLFLVTMDAMRTDFLPDGPVGGDGQGVRQDVPRNDPAYVTNCQQCHNWMDRWVRPFLIKDVTGSKFNYQFKDKLNTIEGPKYPVTNTSFKFFYSQDQNRILGIDEANLPVQTFSATGVKYIEGQNLSDFANIIAHSRGYYRGLVKRIVAQIYMRKLFSVAIFTSSDYSILASQNDTVEAFTDILVQSKDIRDIYNRIAAWYAINDK